MVDGTADCAAQGHGQRGIMVALNVSVRTIEHGTLSRRLWNARWIWLWWSLPH
jgi:hypothetical protein